MSIKYYRLAKDEEPPEEFCAIRDVGGEPSEYVFYVPEAENAKNAKLREEIEAAKHDLSLFSGELVASKLENAKLRELVRILAYCMSEDRDCDRCALNGADMPTPRISACDSLPDLMRELGVEVD